MSHLPTLPIQLPNKDEKPEYVQKLFGKVAQYYDVMNDLMSFGLHRLWKKQATQLLVLPQNTTAKILDLCCGTGDIVFYLNKAYPQAQIIGVDFCPEMLSIAAERNKNNLQPGTFIQADAMNLPFEDNTFDGVTIGWGLRNVQDYQQCLSEIYRVLKPAAKLVIIDMSTPTPVMGVMSGFYRHQIMPLIGRIIANDAKSYQYLSYSITFFLNQVQLLSLMQDLGFKNVQYQNKLGGICAIHWGEK